MEVDSSLIAAMATAANASLISQRSMSATPSPVFLRNRWIAPTGAVVNHSGCCATPAWATMRARGFHPFARAVSAVVTTRAAAPSLILVEFAAVTEPSFLNAGLSVGIFSRGR